MVVHVMVMLSFFMASARTVAVMMVVSVVFPVAVTSAVRILAADDLPALGSKAQNRGGLRNFAARTHIDGQGDGGGEKRNYIFSQRTGGRHITTCAALIFAVSENSGENLVLLRQMRHKADRDFIPRRLDDAARVLRLESSAELYAAYALFHQRRGLAASRLDGRHADNLGRAAVNRGPVLRRIKIAHYKKSELHHCETS